MISRLVRTTLPAAAALLALPFIGACGADQIVDTAPQPPRGIVILDGFIQPGYTFLGDTGSASTKLVLGPTTEFDAGGFTLERDTLLAVSSRGAGDLLYIADVRTSSVRRVQLPARSNPGKARLFPGNNGATRVAVALRDASAIAMVTLANGVSSQLTIGNAGVCPIDMFRFDNATWVVDANANCRVDFAVQGDMRLIRIPDVGSVRDTITLVGVRGSDGSALVLGEVAYVSGIGDANFASFPFSLRTPGAIAQVDLRTRQVSRTRPMPANSFGARTKLGLDGFLYVSLFEDLDSFTPRILRARADDLTFVSGGSAPWLALVDTAGNPVTCDNGQADALGRVHCIVNGTGSATSLLVFSQSGVQVRRVPAGQGGVDLAIR